MSKTVQEFAKELNVPAGTLLSQLRAAGVEKTSEQDPLSDDDKRRLFESLRGARTTAPQRRITLMSKEKSVIKQNDASGRAHTIQVEVRRKRVFMKNPQTAAEEKARLEAMAREEAARREAERKAREEAERREAEEKARREAEEKARREAEEKARREAAEKAAAALKAAEAAKAKEEALRAANDEAAAKAAKREVEKAKLEADVAQATAKRHE